MHLNGLIGQLRGFGRVGCKELRALGYHKGFCRSPKMERDLCSNTFDADLLYDHHSMPNEVNGPERTIHAGECSHLDLPHMLAGCMRRSQDLPAVHQVSPQPSPYTCGDKASYQQAEDFLPGQNKVVQTQQAKETGRFVNIARAQPKHFGLLAQISCGFATCQASLGHAQGVRPGTHVLLH